MMQETVAKIATCVENAHAAPSQFTRLVSPERLVAWLAFLLVLELTNFQPAYGQTSSVLQANQVVAGGETRPASAALQPATAITVEAWVSTPAAVTNYPGFVSYGLDATPYESYVLQAQTIDGNHPADFWFLTGSGTHHQLYGTRSVDQPARARVYGILRPLHT